MNFLVELAISSLSGLISGVISGVIVSWIIGKITRSSVEIQWKQYRKIAKKTGQRIRISYLNPNLFFVEDRGIKKGVECNPNSITSSDYVFFSPKSVKFYQDAVSIGIWDIKRPYYLPHKNINEITLYEH